jgi:hypothetical protein
VDNSSGEALRSELTALREEATAFFSDALGIVIQERGADAALLSQRDQRLHFTKLHGMGARFIPDWDLLSEKQKQTGQQIRKKLTQFGVNLFDAVRRSPLMEQADEVEFRKSLRGMSACLVGKHYVYHSSSIVSDEDKVYGIEPAQHEESYSSMNSCGDRFEKLSQQLFEKMDLIAPAPENLARAIVSSQVPNVQRYRPNTAFIMMQISTSIPELEDVKNCIKEVFQQFGIDAVRSDEIEHSETITQRILDEISTSEFLIADLTGERPSVYYEVGYAHAAGKRPILYRKKGTSLHFDLVVHNVPEYANTTDLKAQLRKRLTAMTNREPKQ